MKGSFPLAFLLGAALWLQACRDAVSYPTDQTPAVDRGGGEGGAPVGPGPSGAGGRPGAGGAVATGGMRPGSGGMPAGGGGGARMDGAPGEAAGTGGTSMGTGGAPSMPPPPPPDAGMEPPPPPPPPPPERRALLVVGAVALPASDQEILTRLRTKLTVDVAAETAATSADAGGKAVIVITSTTSAAGVNTKFRDVATPVILLEPNLMAPMQMTADTAGARGSTGNTETAIAIVDGAHRMAAGLSGTVRVYRAPAKLTWGAPAAAAAIVATVVGNPTQAAIFAYPQGAMMVGASAPAKRAGFFIRENTVENLDENALRFIDAAVDWALE